VALIKEIVADFATWTSCRHYQVEDIVQIVHQYIQGESGVMNANEMALGKTFESIVALYILRALFEKEFKRKPTILWLTKSSIVETGGTVSEFKRWDPTVYVAPLSGSDKPAARKFVMELCSSGQAILLTNYETMRTTKTDIVWDLVVMDEVHKIKGGANVSGPTAVWEAVKDTVVKSRFMMMLTGTPLVNKVEEMWSYLHIFDREAFPDVKQFRRAYSGFQEVVSSNKFSVDAEKLLRSGLRGRLIRRTAAEVGLELPPVTYVPLMLTHNPEQAKYYKMMQEQFFVWLDENQDKALTAMSVLAQLTRLRQFNVLPVAEFKVLDDNKNVIDTLRFDCRDSSKLDEAIRIILETQDQCVVFSNYNEPMEELAFRLMVEGKRPEIINSNYKKDMSSYERGFQSGEIDVLLINSSMGEGLNLHKDPAKWEGGARAAIFLDRWWNNARNDQCEKRIVRPGSTDPVFIYRLFVDHSVDQLIEDICTEKDAMFSSIMDSKDVRPASEWKQYLKGLL
jgi:SNF2 family DNA or RNA helicase